MAVLCLAMDLVQEFLGNKQDEPAKPTLTVVPIARSPSVSLTSRE